MPGPIDLNAEMNLATDAVTPRRIVAAGLDWEACCEAGGIGLVEAETFKDGSYQPVDNGGRWLWCLPCFYGPVEPSTLADIVAWRPEDSRRWYRRTGHAAVIGYANIQRARAAKWDFGNTEPTQRPTLMLHPTPRDYALAGFTGAVVLDWLFGLGELDGVEQLVCGDLAFAEEVEEEFKLNRPPLPAVLVNDRRVAA